MNLGDIYSGINYLISKDVSGYSFTPDQFTLVCNMVQKAIYLEALEAKINPPTAQKEASDIVDISILDQIIQTMGLDSGIRDGNGMLLPGYYFTLPVNFMQQDSIVDLGRRVELLDSRSFNQKTGSPFFEKESRCAKIEANRIVLSTPTTFLNLTYYRNPINPSFDYCYTTSSVIVYMEPGSFLKTSGSLFDLVRAKTAYANSTVYSVGARVTYSGLAYEANTAVLNTNTDPPITNPSFTSLGNITIATDVNHINPAGVNDYVSQSKELDVPEQYHEKFIRKGYEYAMTSLSKNIAQ